MSRQSNVEDQDSMESRRTLHVSGVAEMASVSTWYSSGWKLRTFKKLSGSSSIPSWGGPG